MNSIQIEHSTENNSVFIQSYQYLAKWYLRDKNQIKSWIDSYVIQQNVLHSSTKHYMFCKSMRETRVVILVQNRNNTQTTCFRDHEKRSLIRLMSDRLFSTTLYRLYYMYHEHDSYVLIFRNFPPFYMWARYSRVTCWLPKHYQHSISCENVRYYNQWAVVSLSPEKYRRLVAMVFFTISSLNKRFEYRNYSQCLKCCLQYCGDIFIRYLSKICRTFKPK